MDPASASPRSAPSLVHGLLLMSALGLLCASCPRPQGAASKSENASASPRQAGEARDVGDGHADHGSAPSTPASATRAAPAPLSAADALPGSAADHGAQLYQRMCAVCHGAEGEGYRADQATALAQPDFQASATDQQIAAAIAAGRKGTTMSAWSKAAGGPLTDGDIRALVAFIRTWRHGPSVVLDEAPVRGDVASGKAIFVRECERCHGPSAPNVRILAPQFLKHASAGYLRHALRTGRPPTDMPSYAQTLGDAGIEDVVAYLRSLPTEPAPEPSARPEPVPFKPVPQYPKGPAPVGFKPFPGLTSVAVVSAQLARKARMLFLDARVPSDYELEHIAGAYNVPFYDPKPFLDKLPKKTWIVAYCGCPHAESGMLAKALQGAGFTKVTVLDEGLWEWKQRGHPMRKGRLP